MKACYGAVAAVMVTLASPVAHAMFTIDEMQRGLTEEDALRLMKNRNFATERLKGGDEGFVVLREAGGDVKGMFWVCSGRVHAASALQEGSLVAFIDRVADLSKTHGRGEVAAQIKPLENGTTRTIETFWKLNDNIVKLSYTPAGSRRAEAMWLQSSVPSACVKK